MFKGPTKYSEYIQDVPKSIDYILKRVNAVTVADLQAVTNAGATTTLPINTGGITSDYFQLDTAATPTLAPGMFGWDDAYGTADLRLKGNNVTLQLGQELLARVVNKTGADLLESQYKVVRVRIASEGGAQGQRLAVVLAQGDNDPDSATTLGIVTEDIPNNQEGFITIFGNVNNINTTGSLQGETWVDGDVLYLSPTVPGAITKVKPVAPQHTVIIGYVVYAHNNQGKIFVKVDNGYELDELHNVLITSPANNDLLQYDSAQQVWKNVAPSVAVPTPTLAQVTTAGNTTTNAITVGGLDVKSGSTYIANTGNNTAQGYTFRIWNTANNFTLDLNGTGSVTHQQNLIFGIGNATSYNEAMRVASTRNVLIGTTTDAGYKLDVNGTTRTLASVENVFRAEHTNGNYATILFGNGGALAAGQFGMYFNGTGVWSATNNAFRVHSSNISINTSSSTFQVIGGYGGSSLGTSIRLMSNTFNQGAFTATSGSQTTVIIGNGANETWQPSSGNASYALLVIAPVINTSGTYAGFVTGFAYNPTLTSVTGVTHRAIHTVTGDVLLGTTSGNVGVGTTTPTYKLQVIGSTYNTFSTTAPFLVDTSANNYRIGNLINNSGYHSGGFANNTFDIFSVGANSSTSSNGSQFFRININGGSSSGAYGASGNNVTLAQLNAVTNSILYITAQGQGGYIQGGVSGGLTVSTLNDGENLSLRSDKGSGFGGGGINYYASINGANHSHRWFTTLTEHMRLTSGGNLLIGTTTNAGYKLDVSGTVRFTHGLTIDYFGATIGGVTLALSSQAGGTISSSASAGNNNGPYITLSGPAYLNPTAGNSGMFSITGLYYASSGTAIFNHLNLAPTINNSGTYSGIVRGIYYNPTLTSLTGTTHRAIETVTGDVIFGSTSGNVLIGTTTSSAFRLDVNGIFALGSAGGRLYSTAGNTLQANFGNAQFSVGSSGGESIDLSANSTGEIRFGTASVANRLVIKNNGNVLIGTGTDSGYKLDVNGTGRFTNNLSINKSYNLTWGTNQQINVTDYPSYFSGGYNVMSFISTSSGSYADDGSFVWRNAGTSSNLMVLTGVGNLGLGTSNPTDKFHIVDNTNGNKFGRISAGGTDASAAWVAQNDQVDNIVYRVFGSAVTGSQMGQALARSASLIANLGGTGKFLIGSYSGTDLIFGTSDQARMRLVDATGNFLIGTMTDTGNKLTVSGNIDAQGYKVNNVLGYTGILNIPTNPPGQQNIDIQGGIVINIF